MSVSQGKFPNKQENQSKALYFMRFSVDSWPILWNAPSETLISARTAKKHREIKQNMQVKP